MNLLCLIGKYFFFDDPIDASAAIAYSELAEVPEGGQHNKMFVSKRVRKKDSFSRPRSMFLPHRHALSRFSIPYLGCSV